MTDLLDIWLKLPGVDPVDLDRYCVTFRASQMVGGVRQGKNGWLLPVYVDPPSCWHTVDDPVLLDFVCFDPAQPSRYRTIYGHGAMLGEEAFAEARIYHQPLPVYRTPMGWLQSGGAGACILDPIRFGIAVVGYPALEIVGEDLDHGRALRRLVNSIPRLSIPKVSIAA